MEMEKNFTVAEVIEETNQNFDIRTMLYKVFSEKLYHPNAIKNKYILEGGVDFCQYLDFSEDKTNNVPCLFHDNDDVDNARIYIDSNTFTCFSGKCSHEKKSYNVLTLYMLLRFDIPSELLFVQSGDEFKIALNELAVIQGLSFEWTKRKLTKAEKLAKRIEEIQRRMVEIYHNDLLTHKYAHKAMNYMLETRGFKYGVVPFEDLVKRYKLGYASVLRKWRYVYRILRKEGYTFEELNKASAIKKFYEYEEVEVNGKKEKKKVGEGEIGDFFYDGFIFPYRNTVSDKIYGLYMRRISNVADAQRHRRVEGKVLEPLNIEVASKYESVIITEGEISWLSLMALDYENVILNRGTNGLAEDHILKLKRIQYNTRLKNQPKCSVIYLCFDADEAGFEAVVATGARLVAHGFDVRVIRLPKFPAKDKHGNPVMKGDPNDLLTKLKDKAKETFDECVKNAISYEAYMILHMMNRTNPVTPAEKRTAFKRSKEFIVNTPKEERIFILDEVAEACHLTEKEQQRLWHIWSEQPIEEAEDTSLEVMEKLTELPWVLITDSTDKKEFYQTRVDLQNVLLENPERVVDLLKDYPRINNIVFDINYPSDKKNVFLQNCDGYRFYQLQSSFEESELKKTEIFNYTTYISS